MFLCDEQVDNLRTNHRGTFVLKDSKFRCVLHMSWHVTHAEHEGISGFTCAPPASFASLRLVLTCASSAGGLENCRLIHLSQALRPLRHALPPETKSQSSQHSTLCADLSCLGLPAACAVMACGDRPFPTLAAWPDTCLVSQLRLAIVDRQVSAARVACAELDPARPASDAVVLLSTSAAHQKLLCPEQFRLRDQHSYACAAAASK